MKKSNNSDDLKKFIKKIDLNNKVNLIKWENSGEVWERELFKMTKSLYKQEILPVLLEKIETNDFDRDFIFHNIFLQILVSARYLLEVNDTYIFEYKNVENYHELDILQQIISKRKIILKKEEADFFIRFQLIVPATLVHYLQINNSKWLAEYMTKHKELFTAEAYYNTQLKILPKQKTQFEKEILISKIKEVKEKLIKTNPGKKATVRATAIALKIPDTTFRERLKTYKISFEEI
ncbi:MAG: hypothetical protein A2315_04845 [Ignavibacteria bacterium RIFOXYB2_FULL_35_12]|nr:MAG: hypothetical protein A2058_15740 [Ignavibacteria bacterium GWA2_36_19]OGU50324.1 MAG: hypothetical protein A2006_07700 [Ignavibacteria bacterium GWC2_35_8]OGU62604.1 MAG: hypothetical protein A2X60_07985 [Ignavibacteria bacterium GWF2_35_20]OGU80105.1 MAG: hypothetical protein A2254_11180 [Ignavibacteria bacterium RIFOXYA2_FULL_35_9]OGU89645.1 MAG: hypothetical protein A3K31_15795 [Ignavibacteria bacterium RIFOXYA12_FULL_35_25]OGU94659.1 MAG: hypothetical protein A2347_03365 [Ignavibac